jgi:hypothetical protein
MLIRSKGRMLRRLLNIASIVCLVVCAALMGMWVRSYYSTDMAHGPFLGSPASFTIVSTQGELGLAAFINPGPDRFDGQSGYIDDRFFACPRYNPFWGFGARTAGGNPIVVFPFWFLVLANVALAAAFRVKWSRRFGLRTMLVATTLIAVALGMIVAVDRLSTFNDRGPRLQDAIDDHIRSENRF